MAKQNNENRARDDSVWIGLMFRKDDLASGRGRITGDPGATSSILLSHNHHSQFVFKLSHKPVSLEFYPMKKTEQEELRGFANAISMFAAVRLKGWCIYIESRAN